MLDLVILIVRILMVWTAASLLFAAGWALAFGEWRD